MIEIGCGPGRVTIPLAQAVGPEGEVVALDVQAEMLARVETKAQAAGLSNVRLLRSDVREAPIQDGSRDAAVVVMVLGEIPNHAAIFPWVFRALKAGGRLLVAESVFDPHFVRRANVGAMARAAGFTETSFSGNRFGYALRFERPAA